MDNPLASGDPEVWNTLVAAVHPESLLVVIGYRMGPEIRKRVSAEDILQDALLKAWRGRGEFEWQGPPAFRRWLLRIADRCIEDERDRATAQKRDQGRTVALDGESERAGDSSHQAGAHDPWTSTTPSRMAEATERARAMEKSIEELPDDVREVVRLRLFEDLQIEEIGRALALSESSVRRRVHKGAELYRARLNHLLGPSSAGTG